MLFKSGCRRHIHHLCVHLECLSFRGAKFIQDFGGAHSFYIKAFYIFVQNTEFTWILIMVINN